MKRIIQVDRIDYVRIAASAKNELAGGDFTADTPSLKVRTLKMEFGPHYSDNSARLAFKAWDDNGNCYGRRVE